MTVALPPAAWKKVAHAMTTQVKRVKNNPAHLQERIAELEAQIADLQAALRKAQLGQAAAEVIHTDKGMMYAGRLVGNQSDFAQQHGIPSYQVSRWCGKGQIEFVRLDGKYIVYLDQPCPVVRHWGRKS